MLRLGQARSTGLGSRLDTVFHCTLGNLKSRQMLDVSIAKDSLHRN
jgi:hypothetical protein